VISGTTVYCNGSDLQPLTTIAEPGADVIWYSDALLTEPLGTGTSFIPPSPEDATFYVIQTSGACTSSVSSVSIDITFIDPPVGDTLVTFCEGDITPLLSVSGQGTLNWYSDSQLQNLVNTGFSFQPQASSASFFITATIDACISNPFSVQLVEVPLLDALILSPNGTSLCPGTPITLMSSSAGQNLWSSGETTQSIEVDQAGNYSLERTGECNTATDEVTITGLPVFANFTTDQDSGYLVLPVFITDLSSQADACNWYLNGQFLQFTAPGTLMFPDSGSFQLDLICSNSSGCLDTASTIIKVLSDELTLIVPNVFTPNGDFFNELFQVKHNAVKTFQASIFDRWGRFIYSWENVSQGWNGFTQNEKAMDGTYFYIIRGTDIKDQPFEEKGSVLLIGSTD
jgi:gliding motility-associated-like protein